MTELLYYVISVIVGWLVLGGVMIHAMWKGNLHSPKLALTLLGVGLVPLLGVIFIIDEGHKALTSTSGTFIRR